MLSGEIALLSHVIEVAAIYNRAAQNDRSPLISATARLPMPFTLRQWGWRSHWVTLSKAAGLLQISPIHPCVGHGAFHWEQSGLFQLCLSPQPISPSVSHARVSHRRVVIRKGPFVILVSLHHQTSYLLILSIKGTLLMRAIKCVYYCSNQVQP